MLVDMYIKSLIRQTGSTRKPLISYLPLVRKSALRRDTASRFPDLEFGLFLELRNIKMPCLLLRFQYERLINRLKFNGSFVALKLYLSMNITLDRISILIVGKRNVHRIGLHLEDYKWCGQRDSNS